MFPTFFAFMLLFWILRRIWRRSGRSYHIFFLAQRFMADLTANRGGDATLSGWRRLIYKPSGSKLEMEINCSSRPKLIIRIPGIFPGSTAFYRIPRLIFAFMEAFVSPNFRLDGQPYFVASRQPNLVSDLKGRQGFLPLVSELSAFGFSIYFHENGLTLRKRLRSRDLNEMNFQRMVQLAGDLGQICAKSLINIPVQAVESENRCAYCKEPIHEDASVIYCSVCGTPHHRDCFQLNGKCSVFGCDSVRPVEAPLTVAN